MTTPIDLDALDALLARANPGPLDAVGRAIDMGDDMIAMLNLAMSQERAYAFAALIVAAVNALPALLAHVRALEQDAARYRWLVATTHPENLRKLYYGYDAIDAARAAANAEPKP